MSRLPSPGGDDGSWGDVLNDFLLQSHSSNGDIKPNSIGTTQLKNSAVTAAQIANGTVSETQMTSGVQAKLAQAAQASQLFNETAVQTTGYTASAYDLVVADSTSAPITITLPAASVKAQVAVRWQAGANNVVIQAAGSDKIGAGSATTTTVSLVGGTTVLQSVPGQSRWQILSTSVPSGSYVTNAQLNAAVNATSGTADKPMQRWRAALADRSYGSSDVLVIGDSISEGQGATVKSRRWIEMLQSGLRYKFPANGIAGGEGFICGQYLANSYAPGWSYGNNITGNGTFGFGHRSMVLRAPSSYASRTVYGTSIKILYSTQTSFGSFSVFLDGSGTPAATVSTVGAATVHGGGTATVSLGSRGSHTVRLEWASGGDAYISGLWVYDQDESAGIRVTDSAQYGSTSNDWSTLTNSNQYTLSDDITALQPSLVVIELGANDRTANSSSGTYKNNILALIAQVKAACTVTPSFLLLAAYQEGVGNETWQAYIDKMNEIAAADSNNVYVHNLNAQMPDSSNTALGLYAVDAVHPSDRGHAFIADRVLSLLCQ